jgi:hypothetical protein
MYVQIALMEIIISIIPITQDLKKLIVLQTFVQQDVHKIIGVVLDNVFLALKELQSQKLQVILDLLGILTVHLFRSWKLIVQK